MVALPAVLLFSLVSITAYLGCEFAVENFAASLFPHAAASAHGASHAAHGSPAAAAAAAEGSHHLYTLADPASSPLPDLFSPLHLRHAVFSLLVLGVHTFFEALASRVAALLTAVIAPHGTLLHHSLELRFELMLEQAILHAPFLYEAFVERDLAGVRLRLISFLIVRSYVLNPLNELLLPWVLKHFPTGLAAIQTLLSTRASGSSGGSSGSGSSSSSGGSSVKEIIPNSPTSKSLLHPPATPVVELEPLHLAAVEAWSSPALSLDSEYRTIFTQLTIVSLWGSVFPLAPLLALGSNVVEVLVDASKLAVHRRCYGGEAGDRQLLEREGRWTGALKAVAYFGVITNVGVLLASLAGRVEHGRGGDGWGQLTRQSLLGHFALEHVAIAAMVAVELVLPEHFLAVFSAPGSGVGVGGSSSGGGSCISSPAERKDK